MTSKGSLWAWRQIGESGSVGVGRSKRKGAQLQSVGWRLRRQAREGSRGS